MFTVHAVDWSKFFSSKQRKREIPRRHHKQNYCEGCGGVNKGKDCQHKNSGGRTMADGESSFNPKNPTNHNVDAQFLLIPGILIVLGVGKKLI